MKPKSRKLAVGTKKLKITLEESCMLLTLHEISKLKVSEIIKYKKLFPVYAKYSPATLYRHALKPLGGGRDVDGRRSNKRRPKFCTPVTN